MNNFRNTYQIAQSIFPNWLTQQALVVYILALGVVSIMYSSYAMPWYYLVAGIVSVVVFLYYGHYVSKRYNITHIRNERNYEKKIFLLAFIPRIIWMFFIYYINFKNYNNAFGFEAGDTLFYDVQGQMFANSFGNGSFLSVWRRESRLIDVSDLGFASYVGLVYWLTGNSIIAVRLLKCIWSSITVLLIYRLAKRNFDTNVARVAAVFCALWPNLWYYCGTHLKETEMVFLGVLFVEQADQMLRSRQFTAWKIIPILLIAAALFTVRTPLALVALLSLVFSVVMSSSRVVNWGKRIIVGGLALVLIAVTMGNRVEEQTSQLFSSVQSGTQRSNMSWRAERKDDSGHTQKFAKYAGASVFAPMIFTIPFPTLAQSSDGQDQQLLLNGGNFIKNILSGFTILALVTLLLSGKWREHLLPLSFMLGYLVVLTMSVFAQSERFHQPVMPFELMFAAYGLSIAATKPKYKRWFMYWCGLMFVACIAWNWFKLAGRGLS